LKVKLQRTIVVELRPDEKTERLLREWAENCAVLWNTINYKRRQQFFRGGKVDLGEDRLLYDLFKPLVGSATAQQIMRKNSEAWRSFFALKKREAKGKLPPEVKRVSPPGYWKDRATGRRRLIIVIRRDLYTFSQSGKIRIKAAPRKLKEKYGVCGLLIVRWVGRPRWWGRFGHMEIIYDWVSKKWYVHISVEAEINVRSPPHQPSDSTSVDLGVKIPAAVFYGPTSEFEVYKGGRILAEWFYWMRRIAEYQSKLNKSGVRNSRMLRRLYHKLWRRINHAFRAMIKRIVEKSYGLGVRTIYVGYPKHIKLSANGGRKTNGMVHNLWSFKKLIRWFEEKAAEYGIKVVVVGEEHTSKTCPVCEYNSRENRPYRGLFVCKNCGFVAHADCVAAFNIAHKRAPIRVNPAFLRDSPNGPMARPRPLYWDFSRWRMVEPPRRGILGFPAL